MTKEAGTVKEREDGFEKWLSTYVSICGNEQWSTGDIAEAYAAGQREMRELLLHAVHRNHNYEPGGCSTCEAIRALEVGPNGNL
jgi:hypothetical protein